MNLRDITSLRYSSLEFGFPGRPGRALEIHTTQRIWLISCNDGDDIFDTWVTHISKAANKKPKRTSIQQSKSGKKKTMPRRPSFEEETRMNHLKKQFYTSSNPINISQDETEKTENYNNVVEEKHPNETINQTMERMVHQNIDYLEIRNQLEKQYNVKLSKQQRNTIKTKLSQKLCGPSYNLHSSSFSSEYSMEEEHDESTPSYNCYLPDVDADDGNKNYIKKNNEKNQVLNCNTENNKNDTTERIEGKYF